MESICTAQTTDMSAVCDITVISTIDNDTIQIDFGNGNSNDSVLLDCKFSLFSFYWNKPHQVI